MLQRLTLTKAGPVTLVLTLWLCGMAAFGQSDRYAFDPREGMGILKANLSAVVFKSASLQYEYRVGKRSTVALGFRYGPRSSPPFQETLRAIEDLNNVLLSETRYSNWAITPEWRFYPGKRGAMHGFYLAPYLRLTGIRGELPISYRADAGGRRTLRTDGDMTIYGAGLMTGAQWRIKGAWYLDWWILGAHIGGTQGSFAGIANLSPAEQDDLRFSFDNFNAFTRPLLTLEHEVSNSGAIVRPGGLGLGLRGLGIGIGRRF